MTILWSMKLSVDVPHGADSSHRPVDLLFSTERHAMIFKLPALDFSQAKTFLDYFPFAFTTPTKIFHEFGVILGYIFCIKNK